MKPPLHTHPPHSQKTDNRDNRVFGAWPFRFLRRYENGTGGVAKDESRAAAKYAESASHGNAKAMYNLGNMYLDGEGEGEGEAE